MATPFAKDFDSILAGELAGYVGQNPTIDTSQGSMVFLKSSATAGVAWGTYSYLSWVYRQIFPDTADTEALEHAANTRGLTRNVGESDSSLLSRLLAFFRVPPSGGNANDYIQWALSISGVGAAWCVPLFRGLGTVDVLIMGLAGAAPSSDLIDAVQDYIETVRPVTASITVLAPTSQSEAVTMAVSGVVDLMALQTAITSYVAALEPGETLTRSQLFALAVNAGATDATITTPAENVSATDAEHKIVPGTITVTSA